MLTRRPRCLVPVNRLNRLNCLMPVNHLNHLSCLTPVNCFNHLNQLRCLRPVNCLYHLPTSCTPTNHLNYHYCPDHLHHSYSCTQA